MTGDLHAWLLDRLSNDAALVADLGDPPRIVLDVALGIADLAANRELIVAMRGAQTLKPGDVGFQSRLQHQALIARCDGLGHGELVGLPLAHILEAANGRVAR